MGPDFNNNGRIDSYDVGTLETMSHDSGGPFEGGCFGNCLGYFGIGCMIFSLIAMGGFFVLIGFLFIGMLLA